jgi:uncharacterized protein (TIGR02246 family)
LRNVRLHLANILLLLFTPTSCNSPTGKENEDTQAESQIREIEQAWAETAVTGDTMVIKRILADDFSGTSPEGTLYTKQDFIDEMKANPPAFTSNIVNDVKVRFVGEVAVAQGNETFTRKNGEVARFVWTDVLVQRDGRWQIIAAEDLIAPSTDQPSTEGLFTGSLQNDLRGVDSCRKEYMSAWLAADANHLANVYTSDAIVLYPNQPKIVGRAAILRYFKDFFKQYRQDLFELTSEEVKIVGTLAFDRGRYTWRAVPRAGGDPIKDNGKYLVILQRQENGSWRVARDMDNSDRPLSQTTRGTE